MTGVHQLSHNRQVYSVEEPTPSSNQNSSPHFSSGPPVHGMERARSGRLRARANGVGGRSTIRRVLIHRESFRASILHHCEIRAVLQTIAEKNWSPRSAARGQLGCTTRGLMFYVLNSFLDMLSRLCVERIPVHVFQKE